jgi:uncharacterized membrane protein YedE/YeeE
MMSFESFTPWASLLGGVLIGLAASLLLWAHGRVAGISGIFGNLLRPVPGDTAWRAAFVAGLVLAGLVGVSLAPSAFAPHPERTAVHALVAGLLVGFGTRLGNGCTSGHGVCGLARGSPRSLAATVTFMAVAALTVLVLRVAGA